MANLITLRGISPKISDSAWVADNATISGDVSVGEGSKSQDISMPVFQLKKSNR